MTPGKPIRGGVPICWPWFGTHADSNFPAYGFARNHFWQCDSVLTLINGETELVFSLSSVNVAQTFLPQSFELLLLVRVGAQLHLALTMKNTSNGDCNYTAALHSYLAVGDIHSVTVDALEDVGFDDKISDTHYDAEQTAITVAEPIDRVYQSTDSSVVVNDPVWNRKLLIEKTGSQTTVVWNPWAAAAKRLVDFDNNGYINMLCVEAVNAFDDRVSLSSRQQHTLTTTISLSL